jgi:PPP family 3-phenylpropionic acid transporter
MQSRNFVISFRSPLARFLALYGALYAAFGVQSPYLPSLLYSHGLPPEAIALVLAAGTAIRLAAGPVAGRLADNLDAPKAVLIVCSAAAGLIALGYLPARGLWPLLIVGVIHSAALAPLAPLSDTLALGSATPARQNDPCAGGFYYIMAGCAVLAPLPSFSEQCCPVRRSGDLASSRWSG